MNEFLPRSIKLLTSDFQGLAQANKVLTRATALGLASMLTQPIKSLVRSLDKEFWARSGSLQAYLDNLVCEFDPLLSRRALYAEVVKTYDEARLVRTIVLRPSPAWRGFQPGQYINIESEVNGVIVRRNYSLSSGTEDFVRTGLISITVKQIEDGVVSGHLVNQLQIGDTLKISQAYGDFLLSSEASSEPRKTLFVAAGSGITPIISMIESSLQSDSSADIRLIFYVRGPQDSVFQARIRLLNEKYENFSCVWHFSEEEGHIQKAVLQADCEDITNRTLYLCGPEAFMSSVRAFARALGVNEDAIKQESFTATRNYSNKGNIQSFSGTALPERRIVFTRSGKQYTAKARESLLELAELAGLQPKFGCRQGICHECTCERGSGALLNTLTGQAFPDEQAHVQACIAVPLSDVVVGNW